MTNKERARDYAYARKKNLHLSRRDTNLIQLAYLHGLEDGLEWHYVKDGDLPKDKTEKRYLVALKSEYGGFFYEADIWCESLHCFASNNSTEIYAWKEIVLPKEVKA